MAESDEFSPLIQRHVMASAAELRAEAAAVKLELMGETSALKGETSALKSETSALRCMMQAVNLRSMRMEAALQDLIARVDAS
jgi:hypothetical protein